MNLSKIGRNIARVDNNYKKLYSIASPEDNSEHELKVFQEIRLKEGKFKYMLNNDSERDTVCVLGSSGSGKSYWIKEFCETYHKKNPKNEIFLFSESDSDPLFDDVSWIKRVAINEELLKDPVLWDEFKNCLVIFDDIDATKGGTKKYIYGLRDKLLKNSRKFGVSVIVSNHNMTDGNDTKTLLNESNVIVFFMQNYNRSIEYLLKNYIGIDKAGIQKLRNVQTRATVYIKSYPNIVMTDQYITTVSELNKK